MGAASQRDVVDLVNGHLWLHAADDDALAGDRQQVEFERHAEIVFVLPAGADSRPESFRCRAPGQFRLLDELGPALWHPSFDLQVSQNVRMAPAYDFKLALTRVIEPTGGPGVELATLEDAARWGFV
jgi:hypothetical protein